jgi:hypothetical protein
VATIRHIQSRRSWGARPPKPGTITPQNDSQIREFFIHHPADPSHELAHIDTDQEQDAYMRAIQNFHMDTRGWGDFAYNFAVFQDGRVYRGRGRNRVPAAQLGHNTGTVATLCVLANGEHPSDAMVRSLGALKDYLDSRLGRDLPVRPHSAVTGTECPGPELRAIIPRLNREH